MPSRLLVIVAASLVLGCSSVPATFTFTPSSLQGVWEVVACESLSPRRTGNPDTTPNFKYCFGSGIAYPELSADASDDSADGGGDYYIAGKNILVIRTGVPGGLYSFLLDSANAEQLVWHNGVLRVTLRRVACTWDGCHAPKLQSRNIPIVYPSSL